MHRYLNYIALTLLLLFTRAMVPDALMLHLHGHEHTVHADACDSHKAQVGKKHNHCPVEDLFGAPYQGSVTYFEPEALTHTQRFNNLYSARYYGNTVLLPHLRGPPVA
ncbi:hypothetical protein [Pontibacter arcticus]|uniref:Uncharacterized protein n=1 Tax=Pontibacter arcticus TaxID=2080288 RepID=A0A364RJD9_9BACT|nr:hypothetical protein [Pontibacter arcticus]RAU84393.1 hypothetical protein DP923_04965 [Pontibacter arcticus]